MNGIGNGILAVAASIVSLAVIATLVSNNANTANVIKSGGDAFSSAIQAAIAPVTGGFAGGAHLTSL
jgi:hypothetical protein